MSHPDLAARADLDAFGVPIIMHGDGVAIAGRGKSWSKMLDVWSWCSLLGAGTTLDCMMYIFSLMDFLKSSHTGQHRYRRIHGRLRWSFHWLWLGRFPTHDVHGVAYLPGTKEYDLAHRVIWLADVFFGCSYGLVADLDFQPAFNGTPRVSETSPCAFCPATTREGICPWSDFRTNPPADWMHRVYNVAYWFAANPVRSSLFRLAGVSIWSVQCDRMHIKYLGVGQYFLGSVISVIVNLLMTGQM